MVNDDVTAFHSSQEKVFDYMFTRHVLALICLDCPGAAAVTVVIVAVVVVVIAVKKGGHTVWSLW